MQPEIYLSEVHLPLSDLELPSGPYPKVDYGYLAHVHLKRAFGDSLGAFSIERADRGALVCLACLVAVFATVTRFALSSLHLIPVGTLIYTRGPTKRCAS